MTASGLQDPAATGHTVPRSLAAPATELRTRSASCTRRICRDRGAQSATRLPSLNWPGHLGKPAASQQAFSRNRSAEGTAVMPEAPRSQVQSPAELSQSRAHRKARCTVDGLRSVFSAHSEPEPEPEPREERGCSAPGLPSCVTKSPTEELRHGPLLSVSGSPRPSVL